MRGRRLTKRDNCSVLAEREKMGADVGWFVDIMLKGEEVPT